MEYLEIPLHVQSPYIQAFLTLMQLARGRFSARDVFNALENLHIHTAAQITPQELKSLRRYMQQAPIYWGENTEQREAFLKKRLAMHLLSNKMVLGHGVKALRSSLSISQWAHSCMNPRP